MEKEMVLFPTNDQFIGKMNELSIDEYEWTIPTFPKEKYKHIGKNIYFYNKEENTINAYAIITKFESLPDGKKRVFFKLEDREDQEYIGYVDYCYINLSLLGIPKRKQTRGWAYRWFPLHIQEIQLFLLFLAPYFISKYNISFNTLKINNE